jgi:hypothetical protein
VAYPDIYPKKIIPVDRSITDLAGIEFTGTGIAVLGGPSGTILREMDHHDYTAEIEVSIDGEKHSVRKIPFNYHRRALELFFELELPKGDHTLEMVWLNPREGVDIPVSNCIVFSDQLVMTGQQ